MVSQDRFYSICCTRACVQAEARYILCSCYSGPCIIRQPIQPQKYGLKLKVVLIGRVVYIEHIGVLPLVMLMVGLKTERILKLRGLNLYGITYCTSSTCMFTTGSCGLVG